MERLQIKDREFKKVLCAQDQALAKAITAQSDRNSGTRNYRLRPKALGRGVTGLPL